VAEFDAAFGRTQQLAKALDTLYAGTQLGEEAQRLSRFAAAREGKALAADPLIAVAGPLVAAQLRIENESKTREGEQLRRARPTCRRCSPGVPSRAARCTRMPTAPCASATARSRRCTRAMA
jgi:hypothetical protein